jgi:hypothetical protein
MADASYTDRQKAEFKAEFAVKRRRQWQFALLPALTAVVVIAIVSNKQVGTFLGIGVAVWRPIAFAVVIAAVVFSLVNWRCPACGRSLGRTFNPGYCPRCGIPLRDA